MVAIAKGPQIQTAQMEEEFPVFTFMQRPAVITQDALAFMCSFSPIQNIHQGLMPSSAAQEQSPAGALDGVAGICQMPGIGRMLSFSQPGLPTIFDEYARPIVRGLWAFG